MNYLIGYLVAGFIVFIVIFSFRNVSRSKESEDLKKIVDEIHNKDQSFLSKFLDKIIAPIIGVSIVVCFWPIALFFKFKELYTVKVDLDSDDDEYKVRKSDLMNRLSIDEIENRERVHDPLGAVPELPFGHLNQAWMTFLEKCIEQDELWSFSGLHKAYWGKEMQSGYVRVTAGEPGDYFLTSSKMVTDEN